MCTAGHYSPIVKQLRGKAKPDGMVLVVGGCAEYLAGAWGRTGQACAFSG